MKPQSLHRTDVADPEICRVCGGDSLVVNSRPRDNCRWRVRRCRVCRATWDTFESRIDPDDVRFRSRCSQGSIG